MAQNKRDRPLQRRIRARCGRTEERQHLQAGLPLRAEEPGQERHVIVSSIFKMDFPSLTDRLGLVANHGVDRPQSLFGSRTVLPPTHDLS